MLQPDWLGWETFISMGLQEWGLGPTSQSYQRCPSSFLPLHTGVSNCHCWHLWKFFGYFCTRWSEITKWHDKSIMEYSQIHFFELLLRRVPFPLLFFVVDILRHWYLLNHPFCAQSWEEKFKMKPIRFGSFWTFIGSKAKLMKEKSSFELLRLHNELNLPNKWANK